MRGAVDHWKARGLDFAHLPPAEDAARSRRHCEVAGPRAREGRLDTRDRGRANRRRQKPEVASRPSGNATASGGRDALRRSSPPRYGTKASPGHDPRRVRRHRPARASARSSRAASRSSCRATPTTTSARASRAAASSVCPGLPREAGGEHRHRQHGDVRRDRRRGLFPWRRGRALLRPQLGRDGGRRGHRRPRLRVHDRRHGGRAGRTGRNFAASMSGGLAFAMIRPDGTFAQPLQPGDGRARAAAPSGDRGQQAAAESSVSQGKGRLRHRPVRRGRSCASWSSATCDSTGSTLALAMLDDWETPRGKPCGRGTACSRVPAKYRRRAERRRLRRREGERSKRRAAGAPGNRASARKNRRERPDEPRKDNPWARSPVSSSSIASGRLPARRGAPEATTASSSSRWTTRRLKRGARCAWIAASRSASRAARSTTSSRTGTTSSTGTSGAPRSDTLHSTNNFPSSPGRVCPAPCEAACTLNINNDAIGIKSIEHFIIDKGWEEGWIVPQPPAHKTGKARRRRRARARPGLARSSSRAPATTCDVFEKNRPHRRAAALRHPDFKMEKHLIDRRMAQMAEGVEFRPNAHVGGDVPAQALSPSTTRSC